MGFSKVPQPRPLAPVQDVGTLRVYNKRAKDVPSSAIYVGRPTKWGNPFSHMEGTLAKFKVGSRDEAVESYEAWLRAQPELVDAARRELRGRSLVCWCAPHRCHAEVLIKVANEPVEPAPKSAMQGQPSERTTIVRPGFKAP